MDSFRQVFSDLEKEILLECISEKSYIINDKRTNAISNKLKMQTWKEITHKFNSLPYVSKRTSKQLIDCYKNLKRKANKAKAQDTLNQLRNENPSSSSSHDRVCENPMIIIPTKLEDVLDEDQEMIENSSACESSSVNFSADVSSGSNMTQVVNSNQERDDYRSLLSSLVNRSAFPRRGPLRKRKLNSNEVGNELDAQSKRRAIEEEHKLTIKHMEEKHELEIEILKTKLSIYKIIEEKAKKDDFDVNNVLKL